MLKLDNVIEASLGANVIQGVYNGFNDQKGISDIDDSQAVISKTINAKTAEYQQAGHDAEQAISTIQAVLGKLREMNNLHAYLQELVQKAIENIGKEEEEETSNHIYNLGEQLNVFKRDTQINGNSFFSGEGEDISISVGYGATIKIESPDFGLNVDQYDITSKEGSKALLTDIQGAIEKSGKYQKNIESQLEELGYADNVIENELENEMGVDMSDMDKEYANEVARFAADAVIEDMTGFIESQALIEPDIAAKLLDDKIS